MNINPEDERDPAKMLARIEKMTPAEQDRFEHYRRSRFARASILSLVRSAVPPDAPITEHSSVVVAALAKMYVGDLVKKARAERMCAWTAALANRDRR